MDGDDRTSFLQTAIDDLHERGGATLFLPAGTYRVRELRLRSNVDLVGLGRVSLRLFNPGVDGYLARIIGQSAIRMENLEFDCTTEAGRENTVGCVEIASDGRRLSTDISFSECRFLNAQNNAWLLFRSVDGARVENCQFLDHLRETSGATHGLSISENSSNVRITGCLFDHPSGYRSGSPSKGHIGIDRATDVWIERSLIRRAPCNGITIEDNQQALIQAIKLRDCVISDCGNSGLQIEGNGLVDLSIEGCDFKNNAAFGLRLASGEFFSGRISGCVFTDNAAQSNLNEGHSQLQINIRAGQVAHVSNCIFRTSSTDEGFVHLYYLNGEASVMGCSFTGGANGFGVYALVDNEKQLQRATAAFKDLRFIDVGTPTFRLPQFFGEGWQYGGVEPKIVESTITKAIMANRTEQIFDVWISDGGKRQRGAMLVLMDALLTAEAAIGAVRFQFTMVRGSDGVATFGPVTQLGSGLVNEVAAGNIVSVDLSPVDVPEDKAHRTRLQIRVNTNSPHENSPVTATASLKIMWNGFWSAPVLI